MALSTRDLFRAVRILATHLQNEHVEFSISGGAAIALLNSHHGLDTRTTEDIDVVVRPNEDADAESISKWLYETFPTVFGNKTVYGHSVPTVRLSARVQVDIEMFDVQAWPNRTQYDLSNADNERVIITVDGVDIPIFGPRWQLREKIVTAYERQGSNKERTDLDDAAGLLDLVEDRSVDLSHYPAAANHILNRRPGLKGRLQLKIYCPEVLGDNAWVWNDAAGVYYRVEGGIPCYLDVNFNHHKFKKDQQNGIYYWCNTAGTPFRVDESGQLIKWE